MKRDHGADNEESDTMDKKIREDEDTMRAQKNTRMTLREGNYET